MSFHEQILVLIPTPQTLSKQHVFGRTVQRQKATAAAEVQRGEAQNQSHRGTDEVVADV